MNSLTINVKIAFCNASKFTLLTEHFSTLQVAALLTAMKTQSEDGKTEAAETRELK